jgi:FKBP-type peptidyl-prolyl cis-trans isomerase
MKRTLVLTVALASLLAGCGGSSNAKLASGGCTASESGTKDLKTKPVYTVPKEAAPIATTTTDIVCGTGPAAKEGSAVVAKYVGVNYLTGAEFDSSWKRGPNETFPFTIGQGVIPGFSIGVTGMQAGGRRLVVIPPKDGYGDQGPVPGGTLAFIIDLVSVS